MRCKKCNNKYANNEDFCPRCGESAQKDYTNANIRKFNISSYTLAFDEHYLAYNLFRKRFSIKNFNILINSDDKIKQEVTSFDGLFSVGIPILQQSIIAMLDSSVDILMDIGITNIDRDTLADACGDALFSKRLIQLYDIAEKIEDEAIRLQNLRSNQRSSRSHWRGGGFGIKGALTGAIKAGALNMATGAMRGIGDSLTNSSDRTKIEKMKRDSFAIAMENNILSKAIIDSCELIFVVILTELKKRGTWTNMCFFDTKEQDVILNNYIKRYKSQGDRKYLIEHLLNCLLVYPFDFPLRKDYYNILIELLPQNKNEILFMQSFFTDL